MATQYDAAAFTYDDVSSSYLGEAMITYDDVSTIYDWMFIEYDGGVQKTGVGANTVARRKRQTQGQTNSRLWATAGNDVKIAAEKPSFITKLFRAGLL